MNNDHFRKLVQSTPARQNDGSPPNKSATTAALGAKRSSFVPMTPRPGKAPNNADFAKQIRERHAYLQPPKKYKSSAPKGSKFTAGYTDRAKARQEAADEEDDKAKRIGALEEQVKLGQLPQETFEALRDQITGGDASSTHLVKGLDRKLLERVRRGEDVLGLGGNKSDEPVLDVDEELDKLEEQEIETVKKEKAEKKGQMAPPLVAGVKRSRDEIMAELKAQRKTAAAAKAAAAPKFDSRWSRVGEASKPKIGVDHKGREVLITVDEDGNVKKKVRKVPTGGKEDGNPPVTVPDISKPVLGAEFVVPAQPKPQPEEDDEDIFEGAGTEYNPLGDLKNEDDDSDEGDDDTRSRPDTSASSRAVKEHAAEKPALEDITPKQSAKAPRNYFKDTAGKDEEPEKSHFKGIENVLKKAAKLGAAAENEDDGDEHEDESTKERESRLAKRAKMLTQQDRDMVDMDMGFGGSRLEDEEDGGEGKIRLSEWKGGAGDDGWEEDDKGDKKNKKRKQKKRKGDVNNVADIMRVIEGRKGGK